MLEDPTEEREVEPIKGPVVRKPLDKPSLPKSPKQKASAEQEKAAGIVTPIELSRAGKEAAPPKLMTEKKAPAPPPAAPLVSNKPGPLRRDHPVIKPPREWAEEEPVMLSLDGMRRAAYNLGFLDGLVLGTAVCLTSYLVWKLVCEPLFFSLPEALPIPALPKPAAAAPAPAPLSIPGDGPLANAMRAAAAAKP
jgi:hypothetical protein